MAPSQDLVHRYRYGSNNLGFLTPGSHEHRFFVGVPNQLDAANEVGRALVNSHRMAAQELERHHAEQSFLLSEVSQGLERIEGKLARGFGDVTDAIELLEENLCLELGEIKSILTQVDGKLAKLIYLVEFPRQTESAELVQDGLLAYTTGNFSDAEHCFREAIQRKRTSFQAHLNLAFVLLQQNIGPEAVAHFEKAVDYAPANFKVMTLENLARAHFALENYREAKEAMTEAVQLSPSSAARPLSRRQYLLGSYAGLSGDVMFAVSTIVEACKINPNLIPQTATDSDLEPIRSELLAELEELLSTSHAAAVRTVQRAEQSLAEAFRQPLAAVQDELNLLRNYLAKASKLLKKRDYRSSVRAERLGRAILSMLGQISNLADHKLKFAQSTSCLEALDKQLQAHTKLAQDYDNMLHTDGKDPIGKAVVGTGCSLGCLGSLVLLGVFADMPVREENLGKAVALLLGIPILLLVTTGLTQIADGILSGHRKRQIGEERQYSSELKVKRDRVELERQQHTSSIQRITGEFARLDKI